MRHPDTQPFTGLELGVLAVALVEMRRNQAANRPVLDAIMSIAEKVGITQTIEQGGQNWRAFRAALQRDLEGGVV